MRKALYLTLLLVAGFSCSVQDVCDDDPQPELQARFKTMNGGATADTTLTGLYLYGIRAGKSDSLLLDSATTAAVALPLDPGNDFSRFVLSTEVQADTFTIFYQREFYLISYSCGFAVRYTVEKVDAGGSMILDTEINEATVDYENNQNEEHLWLFF